MKRIIAVTAVALAVAAGSLAGVSAWGHRSTAAHAAGSQATSYTCPMHPDYHSDHPGDCPICGMRLEPERPRGTTGDASAPAVADGAVLVAPERQQAIGIRIGVVGRVAATRLLRTTGRVAPDENRTFPVVAGVSGWIRRVEDVATGDVVKAQQELATVVAPQPEFDTAQESYYTALEMLYRAASQQSAPARRTPSHGAGRADGGLERMADGLRNMGVPTSQLRELARRRELVDNIRVESPVDGVVLKRGVSAGLRFERGFEFYRIADLSRVWIVADVYRDQLPFIGRGASARITTAEASHALTATVSRSEPIFDESTLTLKVRLEAANPNLALKPGMFVDVELPVSRPETLVVPGDAIVDSGLHKTVFVDRGSGFFEPRQIETGARIGDDVEVTKGLTAGERIVISGTFLVDSESRMKAGAKR